MFYACENDVLDKADLSAISATVVWEDASLVESYVNMLYNQINGWEIRTIDNIADEGRCMYPGSTPNALVLPGLWNETNTPYPLAFWQYGLIRKCNEFFVNIEGQNFDADKIKQYKADVKFLRALFYFELVKRYGAVPLIKIPQTLNDPDLFVSRSSVDECIKFLSDELTEAATMYHETGVIHLKNGRSCEGAALALKAKVLLYYASPLFNAGNDAARWTAAANAAKVVMDMETYSLHRSLSGIFKDPDNDEVIFKKVYRKTERTHGRYAALSPLSTAHGDAGFSYPVQELVDAFPMLNGKDIHEADSGYDPQNPYANRDPRLEATIVTNGSTYLGRTQYTYSGHPDGVGSPYATITGYYCRKAIDETINDYSYEYGDDTPFIYIRYGDVLLMYAEAKNEASGPSSDIYAVLEELRSRAGLSDPTVPASAKSDKTSLREFIQNERYIEMAFEQQRYWDLRRWKKAGILLNDKQYHGDFITKNMDGTFLHTPMIIDVNPIVFEERMYLTPISHSDIIANPNLLPNNPGW